MKTTCLLIASIAFLASCKETSTSVSIAVTKEPSAALSAVLAAAPQGEPKAVAAARTSAKPGDEITLSGKIMGNAKPFVDGRAVFILGDPDVLTACNETPGDNCETPWDACCDSPEDKKRGTATIQILGADGRVLKEPVEGIGGIANLASVTVTGKVAESSTPELLIVNASAIQTGK
jgi:hypothetical protein